MLYTILADCIIAIHLGYVGFVVVAQLLILIGIALRWQWVRNLRFRVTHLVMVEVVALEGLFGILCPLTTVEDHLRAWARGEILTAPAPVPEPQVNSQSAPEPAAQPMIKETQPALPAVPQAVPTPTPVEAVEPIADSAGTTFVGRLLDSILFVPVSQTVLDRWYVRFGLVTLVIFVGFPPRRGAWSLAGFNGMILLWIGSLFTLAVYADSKLRQSPQDTPLPMEIGVALIVLGAECAAFAGCRQLRPNAESLAAPRIHVGSAANACVDDHPAPRTSGGPC